MNRKSDFSPDWSSAPGETITEVLTERSVPIVEFSKQMDQTCAETEDLISGRKSITIATARRLSKILGASVEFWMSRDFQYRGRVANEHGDEAAWIRSLPLSDMTRFGWIKPSRPTDQLAELLRYFDVPSVSAWFEKYSKVCELASFRASKTFDSSPTALAAWLREGERRGSQLICNDWDPERFHRSLTQVRTLTRQKDPARFLPTLQRICAEGGVAVVVVRCPSGCRASGAARLVSPVKAVIQLSFRHLTDDQFWFTFFHEAAHILLHSDKGIFVDGLDENPSDDEREADQFACDTLIPGELQPLLVKLRPRIEDVLRFSMSAGIAPGIVVGQLQHSGRIRENQLNGLKRRYHWT